MRANFGIDAPGVIRNVLLLAVAQLHEDARGNARAATLAGIARVTRPGGRVLLQDFRHTREYADALRTAEITEVRRALVNPMLMFPPTWRVRAIKPAA